MTYAKELARRSAPDPGPPLRDGAHWEVRQVTNFVVLGRSVDERCVERVPGDAVAWRHCWAKAKVRVGGRYYCGDHIDWRWISGGRVWEWTMRNDRPASLPVSGEPPIQSEESEAP